MHTDGVDDVRAEQVGTSDGHRMEPAEHRRLQSIHNVAVNVERRRPIQKIIQVPAEDRVIITQLVVDPGDELVTVFGTGGPIDKSAVRVGARGELVRRVHGRWAE